jgi:SnoaL-like domain
MVSTTATIDITGQRTPGGGGPMAADHDQGGESPARLISELVAAIAEQNVQHVLASLHPKVVFRPITRPGLTQYTGHDGVSRFLADLITAYGSYRFDIYDITVDDQPDLDETTRVLVRGRVIRQTEDGDLPEASVSSTFTVHQGKVISMESAPSPTGQPTNDT